MSVNIAGFTPYSTIHGPGLRAVLWTQGCDVTPPCNGCVNPDLIPNKEQTRVSVEALYERIIGVDGIEGLTISGGEPTAQALPLAALCKRLRSAGLTIVCYSGYTLEALQKSTRPGVIALLNEIDILIDGRYEAALRQQDAGWGGSSNQRTHYLTSRYQPIPIQSNSRIELSITPEGHIKTSGFTKKNDPLNKALRARLAERGVRLKV